MLAKLTDEGTRTSENLVRWMRAKKSSPFEVTIGQKALNSFQKAWRLFKTAVPSKLPFIWQTATIGRFFPIISIHVVLKWMSCLVLTSP